MSSHSTTKSVLYSAVMAHVQYGDFTLSSGKKSNFYFNGRGLTMDPVGLQLVIGEFMKLLYAMYEVNGSIRMASACAGVVVGACPLVTGLAMALAAAPERVSFLPERYAYIRKEPKGHGLLSQIEGSLIYGDEVVLLEDTITSGGTILRAVEVVESLDCYVENVLCILDREEGGGDALREQGIAVHPLFTRSDLTPA